MAALYARGLSSDEVGVRIGREGRTVRTHLTRRGLLRNHTEAGDLAVGNGKIRLRKLNEKVFDTWTPEAAWLLGLIYGDGHIQAGECNGTYGLWLCGTEQVTAAAGRILGSDSIPKKAKKANCWYLTIYSKQMIQRLQEIGVPAGNKAAIIRVPTVPKEMRPHFVRGLWDADGCWARRGRSIRAQYSSASGWFLVDLCDLLLEELSSVVGSAHEHSQQLEGYDKTYIGYAIHLSVETTRQLACWLYASSRAGTRCSRKYGHVGRLLT